MRWKTEEIAGWGRSIKATTQIARPDRQTGLEQAPAAPAMGRRRSYGDAALNDDGRAYDMTKLDRFLNFDKSSGHLCAEAGVTLGEIARVFAPKGWIPPVMPGTGFATLGGAIAMDVHGKNHHVAGSFGEHLKDITLVQNGARRRITPRDRSLWQATIGGLGQTGLIVEATLALAPCPGTAMQVTERRADTWDEHLSFLMQSKATYCVGWIDATASGSSLGRGIVEEAEIAPLAAPKSAKPKSVPLDAPGFALSSPVVRLFNSIYYRRVPEAGRTVTRSFDDFFFPLDRIHDWNRLYGKAGFHQFQCVVPQDRAEDLRAMLRMIAGSGMASPLAVLKRLGAGRAGYMSFPMEGLTLAVDFRNRDGVANLARELEDMAANAGGRIYLAKDSLSSGQRVKSTYPDWSKWRDAAEKADPDHALETGLVRRLNLRSDA